MPSETQKRIIKITFSGFKRLVMEKQEHIIQSAQTLFAQFGLKKVTTDDVAREAHVSKATIYKLFKNKNEIFDCVIQAETDQLMSSIRGAVKKQKNVAGKLKAHLMTRLGKIHEFVNFYRVTQETWGDYWPSITKVRHRFLKAEKDVVRGILAEGIERNELSISNLNMAAHVLIVALASVEYQWALDEYRISLETMVDSMLEMMLEGIRKR